MNRLCLFDFDGTLSTKDSFLLFLRYARGLPVYGLGCLLLSPRITLFLAGQYANEKLKQDFITHFLGGWSENDLATIANRFADEIIPTILRPQGLEQLAWHRKAGDEIAIVTASLEPILASWCKKNEYTLIASRPEIMDQKITGKLHGLNCRNEEKVNRINAAYDLSQYSEIWAYGDTSGDEAMLDLADRSFFKPFRNNDQYR